MRQPPPMESERVDYAVWDKAELDRQYSPSSCITVPLQAYFDEYAAASRRTRNGLRDFRTHSYGEHPDETLDLFLPPQRPAPLLVFFHGGYWQMLGKDDFSYLAPAFIARGIGFASVNYSLLPHVRLDSIVAQARRSVGWLGAQAGTLGIDAGRIFVSGHSAGAHLAALCMSASGGGADCGARIRGACLISGIFDLEPLRHTTDNNIYRFDAEAVRLYSPIRAPLHAGKTLIGCFGSNETREFKQQTARYLELSAPTSRECLLLELFGRNHFDVVSQLGNPDSLLYATVRQMIDMA